ncbi:hypothetical protein HHK36_011308 [Tetracentron sinense]|uniref:AT-hook motif nuclear-localized protein n=1 Tax=Tetracentron sinense TaxID=13715 RepID=A0A834Z7U1_TETSI|nr:hypothetical protein HHK36_011308 [Tetracentron sinense]
MEEKDSRISGSALNTETESPQSDVVPKEMDMSVNMGMDRSLGFGGGRGKRKRGRPRKYDVEASMGYSNSTAFSEFIPKRGRGRPKGSGKWQRIDSLGGVMASTAGLNFTPHVLNINAGEDVAARIFSISLKRPLSICILSANGAVSNVTLRQPGSYGGGRFEILSLNGSFTLTDSGGVRRTGGLSVSLAGPDGRVIGGGVVGLLIAANPIQLVLGTFMPNICKTHKRKYHLKPSSASAILGAPNIPTAAARPISEVTPPDDHTSMTLTSALPRQIHGEAENGMSSNPNLNSSFHSVGCHGSQSTLDQTLSPDVNSI